MFENIDKKNIYILDIELKDDDVAYIPLKLLENETIILDGGGAGCELPRGTRYKITKDYTLKNTGTKKSPRIFRKWNKVDVIYSSKITAIEDGTILRDEDFNLIFNA